MVHITKQQIFVLFVLLMFLGSSAAFAFMNVIEVNPPKQQLVFDGPLSNADEAVFLRQNKVVAKYFWSENCTACPEAEDTVDSLFNDLAGGLVVEKVDVDKWPEAAEAFQVTELPALDLKGNTIERFDGNFTYDEAYSAICDLFFQPVDQCLTG